jgi:endonuclease/exonuclease/phosphatase family metal-dependent hydrolase
MAEFTSAQWVKVNTLLDSDGDRFGLPRRRSDSVVLASFNIRKLGEIGNKSAGAWQFLRRFCANCDLIAIQEVQDDLDGLNHLKSLLGAKYGMAASDITGGIAGQKGMVERLAFLFRWDRVERTEVASDITIDRSAVLDTLYDNRTEFRAALKTRTQDLEAWQAKVDAKLAPWKTAVADWEAQGRPGKKPRKPRTPKKPPFVLPRFLTFIRTPTCMSFRITGGQGAVPYEFLAVNAHLLYGDKTKQKDEREMEFYGLVKWLVERARQAKRMYHRDMILLGDLNLDFRKVDQRRDRIVAELKALNGGDLKGKGRATVNFPFLTVHPSRTQIQPPSQAVFRSTARRKETYDQIAIFSNDTRLPRPPNNAAAGTVAGGFDYGVFNFADLFAEALHGKPLLKLSKTKHDALLTKFEHDVSDHMPIWVRLAKP